jgi:hypothetical protein
VEKRTAAAFLVAMLIATGAAACWPKPGYAAQGSAAAQGAYGMWKLDDECVKRAFQANPDHTREAIAARDKLIRQCKMQSAPPVEQRIRPFQKQQ